ncbi:SDR family NAD(P)-dependent oxidoreductase [Nocardia ninae]|uniref:Short-chain dehydrogenase/reductase n=1 Tax=Nocardia ninae NBRC 108245 TaxID=1210091 RepID=A0A511MCR3_9NOCA|nr:SDR family NAD(P)-dependent oxidoreductase [Nocardia ninae]GEM38453.1 short-chain dehydrogenase/reductase [Nocardia ninae NBRC 108245]
MTRVWLITGASRGLGRAFAAAALQAGDRVIGVARNIEPLADLARQYPDHLVPMTLDVTDRPAVFVAVEQAASAFGRLDIVVNNAGAMLLGMVEEASEEQIRAHFDVNLFGAVWVTQAVLPHLRAQGGGRILQVTTMGTGGGFPMVGMYAAGKSALDSVSEAVAMEAEQFGVELTIVQMGGYDTGLFTTGTTATTPDPHYQQLRDELIAMWGEDAGPAPDTAAPVIMELVDLPDPPRRLIVGSGSFDVVQQDLQDRAAQYRAYEHLSRKVPG